MKKWIIGTATALILLAAVLYALQQYYKPHADIASKPPQHKVDANTLFDAFKDNEQAANKKYNGKVIQVSGTLQKHDTTEQNKHVLLLNTEDDFFGISCYMDSTFSGNPKVGTKLEVKGKCDGYTTDVVLSKCILVE